MQLDLPSIRVLSLMRAAAEPSDINSVKEDVG